MLSLPNICPLPGYVLIHATRIHKDRDTMFTLRPATKQDIAAVDALLARSYPRLLRPDYPPSTLILALPKISRAQPELVTCGTYYLVEEEGALLGAGGWTANAPGKGGLTRGVGHVRHVVTDDRATRRGVGRRLLTHIAQDAKSQGLRRLHCYSTLTAAAFYGAMEFDTLGPITIPLGPGIDFPAIEMERHL
jgi:N-acetylglutamate synthase-like GNAT family acetyltransferase